MPVITTSARHRTARGVLRSLLLAALLIASLGTSPSLAGAQEDPYGSTSTTSTSQPGPAVSCSSFVTVAEVGAQTTVTVTNVPLGQTVRILIGGVEAGRATAPSAFQDGVTTLEISATIPDIAPGPHPVVAVGAGFNVRCGDLVEIQGSSDSGGSDVLAFTGMNILILIAVALLLLLIGRHLIKRSRRHSHSRSH